MIMIVIDSSYKAQIFLQNKNSMREHAPFTHIYSHRKSFCKTETPCTSTHHSRTFIHVDIHIIYCHRNGLPRFVKRPV